MRSSAPALLLLASCAVVNDFDERLLPEATGPGDEVCDNGEDDDGDGLVDCADPNCAGHPRCREGGLLRGSPAACRDGVDNDGDGLADCEDEACFGQLQCFPAAPLARDAPCEASRPEYALADDFDAGEIDAGRWESFGSDAADRPSVGAGRLDVNGRDGFRQAGLTSRDWIQIGLRQSFELTVQLAAQGDCSRAGTACALRIAFHTREEWGDLAEGGVSILEVTLDGGEAPGELVLRCAYRERPLTLGPAAVVPYDVTVHLRVSEVEQEWGSVVTEVEGEEDVVCRIPPLAPAEPPARLVLAGSGRGRDTGTGRLLLEGVRFDLDRQPFPARCKGLRRPLLEDRFCDPASFYSGGASNPRLAWDPSAPRGRIEMLFDTIHGNDHRDIGHATSGDGGTDWTAREIESPALGDHVSDWLGGALVFDRDGARFETWAGGGAGGVALYTASALAPAAWGPTDGAVTLGGTVPPGLEGSWVPETVARVDGRTLGWYEAPDERGRPALYLAESEDGLDWWTDGVPVLAAGPEGAWDEGGAGEPAVDFNGHYLLMAYVSKRFGEPAELGLAVSDDGRRWVRHADNPLVVGEDAGFDDGGVHEPAVLSLGEAIRIWYTAHAYGQLPCEGNPRLGTGQQRRLALTELRYVP